MKIPTAMDDSSVSHHNGGQVGSQIGVSVNKQNDEPSQSVQYSIPGILHFIQHEWARFELERSQWEVDRAEFEARIAFLQGERKGQENLKNDLVRRIKMLEYALKQERAKFHKLKYGVELQQGDVRPPSDEPPVEPEPAERAQWKQGRQLIKQYLQLTPSCNIICSDEPSVEPEPAERAQWKQGRQLIKQYLQPSVEPEPAERAQWKQGRQLIKQYLQPSVEPEPAERAQWKQGRQLIKQYLQPSVEPEPAERAQWKQGRQLIKQYLQEIGYTDTILDVRSNRVRALLGLNNEEADSANYRNYEKQQHDRCDSSMNYMARKYGYVPAKKSAGLDVEPLYTFRAHTAPVLCLAMGAPRTEECFSGGLDGTIRVWNLPPPTADPYDPYDPAVQAVLRVSCESAATRVRAHPTLPLLVTAHEDRHIRFWDAVSGRCAHAMVAHLDAVTGLALDPNGLFLLSGSHDCSVRLWNLDTKTCVQEITAHRKKFDESILDVAFHPLRPYIASAGADGLAK
ncbi:putative striatin, partial [Operophtera brumata]